VRQNVSKLNIRSTQNNNIFQVKN